MKISSFPYQFYLFWLIVFLTTQNCYAFLGKYPIQNFTTTDYKAGIQNIDFAQNRDMGIFVANNLGVLSFNGSEWEVNAFRTGKKQRSLAFDENSNRLYIGSQGDFGFFEKDWEYVSLLEMIPAESMDFDEVWDVFIHNSDVYFCTFQGIYIYDGQRISVVEHPNDLDRSFMVGGKLFIQSQQGELFELIDNQLSPVSPQKQTTGIIAGIIPQDEGYLFFYNSGKIELSTFFGISSKHLQLSQALRGKYVNHVLMLSDTRLAISTQTAGVFLYDIKSQTIENITSQDGLISNACLRAFQDHNGNLWIGMQNGIAVIDINSPIRLINKEVNIQGSGYEAFEREEGFYYTTSNGIYFLATESDESIFLPSTEGPAYGMQELSGKLYASHHTGLFLLANGQARRLATTDGLWQIKQLRAHPQYAIGGTYSGLFLFQLNQNMELQPIGKVEGFFESSRFFEEDQEGNIWVGQFYKGLYKLSLSEDLKKVSVNKISSNSDLPIGEQIILSKINNELYLATKAGIYRIDQASNEIVEAEIFKEKIGKQPVDLLMQDAQKNIYVFSDTLVGFFKQVSSNNYLSVPSSLYQLRYSFNNDLLYTSINVRNGVLFNANEGFIYYDPALENRTAIESQLLIEKVFSVTEDSILYQKKPFEGRDEDLINLSIGQKTKVLQFHVSSFRFRDVKNQQFRFFLEGFDDSYSSWADARTKEYTNLKSGNYTFYVQTRNHLGEIRTTTLVQLNVSPPFYASTLAILLYIALGILIMFMISRLQKQKYKRKAEKIEAAKQLALAKKQKELMAMEEEKKRELLQLQEEKMKSELQHLNSLLAASTMNIVVKNEFIETIKEELQEVKRKGKSAETKKALERLVREIDYTLRLQEDWEHFKLHFDQVHGDFLARLRDEFEDLSPNDHKLCAFLRLNLETKEMANLMGISIRGIEVARYRLRKKLGLQKGQNLTKFILEY